MFVYQRTGDKQKKKIELKLRASIGHFMCCLMCWNDNGHLLDFRLNVFMDLISNVTSRYSYSMLFAHED